LSPGRKKKRSDRPPSRPSGAAADEGASADPVTPSKRVSPLAHWRRLLVHCADGKADRIEVADE
jgi:hypothetical protein